MLYNEDGSIGIDHGSAVGLACMLCVHWYCPLLTLWKGLKGLPESMSDNIDGLQHASVVCLE